MEGNNGDSFFWVKWKNERIGVLARIEGIYYARFNTKYLKDKENGKIRIKQLSFEPDVLYENPTLFEVFQRRIKVEPGEDPCYRLKRSSARRPVDNFSVKEMNREQAKYFKKIIKELKEKRQGMIECAYSRN